MTQNRLICPALDRSGTRTILKVSEDRQVLFSYDTPVGLKHNGHYVLSNQKFSKTTTGHQRDWVRNVSVSLVSYVEAEAFERTLAYFFNR